MHQKLTSSASILLQHSCNKKTIGKPYILEVQTKLLKLNIAKLFLSTFWKKVKFIMSVSPKFSKNNIQKRVILSPHRRQPHSSKKLMFLSLLLTSTAQVYKFINHVKRAKAKEI